MNYSEQKQLEKLIKVLYPIMLVFNLLWLGLSYYWSDSMLGFFGYWFLGSFVAVIVGALGGLIISLSEIKKKTRARKTYKTTNTLLLSARMN